MKLPEIPRVAWFVYIIRADDDSLYTGITTDVERRFQEHLEGPSGARYFNGRKPVEIVHIETLDSRSSASIREAEIKRMSRQQKLKLFSRQ
ncbi:MAG: GIY-YIG nuclease family protein [Xanthomonadales bacterium]|nr:GIY-YIG nuclease family protein [Xanthomonadales bacterium]MDH3923203.1 GIY-YIG nuclease family protein [Xanthomonadales bacterium]MDH4002023.1 GIY-YIG nuclease family protein [Xanthomonadales bacterium]